MPSSSFTCGYGMMKPKQGDEVVISGISGTFPKSDNVQEFMENLYNKRDMVDSEESNFSQNDLELPRYYGKISNINKFDAQFFKVGYQLACKVEPMSRKLLEHAYAAIFDSGTNPLDLKGKKVGVYIGATYADFSNFNMYDVDKSSNFIVNAGSKSMYANRISYWIDGKGPSFCLDYAEASSIAAFEQAYNSINAGDCEAALVGGSSLCFYPNLNINLRKAGLLCLDGKTKCFDKNADGYVRSDAVSIVFLQKAKDAKRIYAEVCHIKGMYALSNDAKFLPMRKSDDIEKFLKEFYSEIGTDPDKVEYVEAQGTAIQEADENEITAISKIFANRRSVQIGCVKSNMGCAEAASGLCALTKLCLSYHTGEIPANLHYSEPQNISPIKENRVNVLTNNTPFDRSYVALNNFSMTGANYHVLLKGMYKEKNLEKYKSEIPHIVLASGRQEDCVNGLFSRLTENPIDPEQIGLLHNIYKRDIPGHTGRGYSIIGKNEKNETVQLAQKLEHYSGTKRPLWFVYSGMGSQWVTMGADLMRIPIFANAVHQCNKVLESKGIDLIEVLTSKCEKTFENPLNAFVGIGAVQIGLTDILKELGIVPDNIIGHSLGEITCGYHDNTLTKEEVILVTYNRGVACLNAKLPAGSMAAVGLGYKNIKDKLPPEIDVACHNSSTSTTLSGPAEEMKHFVSQLTNQGVFARAVQSANIAYHSRYIEKCGPELLKLLKEVIKEPKPRSERWLSTSVPQDKWDSPLARYSSAEYYTNNLLKPVLFEEASSMIPDNAIVVEIAPHGLLQAILTRSHENCTHIPLTRRGCPDGIVFLLEAIGKLYLNGINPKVDVLYPKIEYPVSTETPLLSHFVEWEHSEDWPMQVREKGEKKTGLARNIILSIYDDDFSYLEGNVIEGNHILPEAAMIVLVWETLPIYEDMDHENQCIIFSDVKFHSQVHIDKEQPLQLSITVNRGNHKFEILHDDILIASGIVWVNKNLESHREEEQLRNELDQIILSENDVYRILESRGFNYRGQFKSIHSSNVTCNKAYVKYTKNWVTLLDSLIQLNCLANDYDGISIPKFIKELRISVHDHKNSTPLVIDGIKCYNAEYNDVYGTTRCAGIQIDTIRFDNKIVEELTPDIIETKVFYPHFMTNAVEIKTILKIFFQIISENTSRKELKFLPLFNRQGSEIYDAIKQFSENISLIDADVKIYIENKINGHLKLSDNDDVEAVVVYENLLSEEKKIFDLQRNLRKCDFVIAIEQTVPKLSSKTRDYFTIISSMSDGKRILVLLKKINLILNQIYIPISSDNDFTWMTRIYDELKTSKHVVLVSERQPYCGLEKFVNKLRRCGSSKVSLIAIDDFHAPKFNPDDDFYKEQLRKNLAINILNKGQWGGYYYTNSEKTFKTKLASLTSRRPGDLNGLVWTESPSIEVNNNRVQVYFAEISQRDAQRGISEVKSGENHFGMAFSGIHNSGEKVMGVISGGAVSSTVLCDPDLLWPVPEHWSLEDSATVPLPYLQAYYCLTIRGHLRRGDSVLITGGAGALGQAAISLCLALDCCVYATVINLDKKKLLLEAFPQLNEHNICYSSDDSVLSMMASNSRIDSCKFVINCSSGSLRKTVMKCVGFNGNFMDFSNVDMSNNREFGMYYTKCDKSYSAIDICSIFRKENISTKKKLQTAITEGIRKGIVRPLCRVVYPPNDVTKAFRLKCLNRSRGSVLINMRDSTVLKTGFEVIPRIIYASNGVYIVVCDEEGVGIEFADRLIKHGANKIVLNMKSNLVTGYLQTKFRSWMKRNATIKLSTDNLSTEKACTQLLEDISKMGSVVGVFIVQDSIKDTVIEETPKKNSDEIKNFTMVVKNLDMLTRNNDIRYFAVFVHKSQSDSQEYTSSMTESVCKLRNDVGLPALIVHYNTDKFIVSSKLNKTPKLNVLSELFGSMEIGLRKKYTNIRSFNLKKEFTYSNFTENISRILGVKKLDCLNKNITLRELQVTETAAGEIRNLVKRIHKVDYTIEKLQDMTLERLMKIGRGFNKNNTNFNGGLEVFYSTVEDECHYVSQSQPVVQIPTLLSSASENNIDPNGTYLVMVPGFEGRYQIFNAIAERLKIQTVAIQLGPDLYDVNTAREIALVVREYMKSKFVSSSNFYILGYSFGVNIVLELASILESEGLVGTVFCLDSGPDVLKYQFDAYVGELDENCLENAIVDHFYYLMSGKRSKTFHKDLQRLKSFDDKTEAFVHELKEEVSSSHEYKRCVLKTAYERVKMAFKHSPDFLLNSEIVLIKGIPHPNAVEMNEDYGLSKYTTKPVRVYKIDSDHAMAPYDCRVSNIVNRILQPELLEEFKNNNKL